MDYKEMYLLLFRGITVEIERLQALQQQAEALFIEREEPVIVLVPKDEGQGPGPAICPKGTTFR